MKTRTNILTHRPIDTVPLAENINRLYLYVIALLDSGRHGEALEAMGKARRSLGAFCKAEFANAQRKLKLDMLSHKHWRRLVLKELGGAKALARWCAAMERCKLREAVDDKAAPEPSAWRKTPEVMAEELRLKAHARKCAKATVHPRITRDPFKMDGEGQFRLPPLPRLSGPRDTDAAWTTPFKISDYNYDATPVTKVSGYDAPIMIWPAEFEAAELWDYERWLRERRVTNSQWCHSVVARSDTRNPCLNISPKDDVPLSGNIQAWVPGVAAPRGGMTDLTRRPQTKKEDNGLGHVNS